MFNVFRKKKFYPYPIINICLHTNGIHVNRWVCDTGSSMQINGRRLGSEPCVVVTINNLGTCTHIITLTSNFAVYHAIRRSLNAELTVELSQVIMKECSGTTIAAIGAHLLRANAIVGNPDIQHYQSVDNIF